mmetsp:Transcript_43949/g.70332  ORF Transcript_43949/g.70332 Transcript_43949/m.70332 type:complete len:305 (+) Transcript_43949:183-1097(+)
MMDAKQHNNFEGGADGDNSVEGPYADAVPVPPPSSTGMEHSLDHGGLESQDQNGEEAHEDKVSLELAQQMVFSNGGYPLLVFLASIVLMISASSACSNLQSCVGKYAYAVAASVISLVVCFAFLFLEKKESLDGKQRVAITVFLFLWWVFVAAFCTFSPPFETPGNGYFACWGGLVGTLMMLMNEVGKVREAVDRFSQVGHKLGILIVGSVVVFCAGIGKCSNGCAGTAGYAIAAGVISFVIAVLRVVLAQKLSITVLKGVTGFLILWWVVGLIILTFVNPFTQVGNGYFATWACLIASILLLN